MLRNGMVGKKYFIIVMMLIIIIGIVSYRGYLLMIQQTVIEDGDVFAGTVRIADEKYVYTAFESIGRTKKIAEIDNWDIYEISEDSEHIFLKMKSLTGEEYIVREDYQIPTAGKVSCAYIDGERVDDENILEALTDILSQRDDAGTLYYISDNKQEKDKWKQVVVGYEDCPVGTDYSIYGISKVDSKWVVVFRDEVGKLEGNKFRAIYHEVDEKYNEVFECSKIWMH
jgi:hypothetical protein